MLDNSNNQGEMHLRFPTRLMIVLGAIAAMTLLSLTKYGNNLQTLIGHGQEEPALLALHGLDEPRVALTLATHAHNARITLKLNGRPRAEDQVQLVIPLQWMLSEIQGIHIQQVQRIQRKQHTVIVLPKSNAFTLTFLAPSPSKLAFISDAQSLLTATTISLPEQSVHRETHIVERNSPLPLL